MGTARGVRTRKYHGFFQTAVGRGETSFLADFDLVCNGVSLWPGQGAAFEMMTTGPRWRWKLKDGELSFRVEACEPGGIRLVWSWASVRLEKAHVEIRPFCAMRALHGLGGQPWTWKSLDVHRFEIVQPSGEEKRIEGELVGKSMTWVDTPTSRKGFHYPEEQRRGYEAVEDLFSAGVLKFSLQTGELAAILLVGDSKDLPSSGALNRPIRTYSPAQAPACGFILKDPPGVIAGFPWFGEWGRDTFVSLPGITWAYLNSGAPSEEVWDWSVEVLRRWGRWIRERGMLPNFLSDSESHQWESSDATLWWTHSLAALWAMNLPGAWPSSVLQSEFQETLEAAIVSIREGRHRFLRQSSSDGLLEVTEPHTTWMDAKVDGEAQTPRIGKLPEINALWFQALLLRALWRGGDSRELLELGRRILFETGERERPNRVFLHSLPFSPSFVLRVRSGQAGDEEVGELTASDMRLLSSRFWTPVGLRTLDPLDPRFRPTYSGSQADRDRAYHQGIVWGWLGGHFEMAQARSKGLLSGELSENPGVRQEVERFPIPEQVPELFDANPPFAARGAPAQAWSAACREEAASRRRLRTDIRITEVLARLWLVRNEHRPIAGKESAGKEKDLK